MNLSRHRITMLVEEAKADAKTLILASTTPLVLTIIFAVNFLRAISFSRFYTLATICLVVAWLFYSVSAVLGARALTRLSGKIYAEIDWKETAEAGKTEESKASEDKESSNNQTGDAPEPEEDWIYSLKDLKQLHKHTKRQRLYFLLATAALVILGLLLVFSQSMTRVGGVVDNPFGPQPNASPCIDCKDLLSKIESISKEVGKVSNVGVNIIGISPEFEPQFKSEFEALFKDLFDKLELTIVKNQNEMNQRIENIEVKISNRRYTSVSIRKSNRRVNKCPCSSETQKALPSNAPKT